MNAKITIGFGFEKDGAGKARLRDLTVPSEIAVTVSVAAEHARIPGYSLSFNFEGGWMNPAGKMVFERGATITGYAQTQAEITRFRTFAEQLCREFDQECVVFAVEPVQSFEYLSPMKEAA